MTWRIGPGSAVVMHYRLALEDGTEIMSTPAEEPLEFTMGDETLVRGLELALYGLAPGDKQTLLISPKEGYGLPEPQNVYTIKRDDFPTDIELVPGTVMSFALPNDEDHGEDESAAANENTDPRDDTDAEVLGTLVAVEDDTVTVDFNHPLAGRELSYSVEILEVGPPVGMV